MPVLTLTLPQSWQPASLQTAKSLPYLTFNQKLKNIKIALLKKSWDIRKYVNSQY